MLHVTCMQRSDARVVAVTSIGMTCEVAAVGALVLIVLDVASSLQREREREIKSKQVAQVRTEINVCVCTCVYAHARTHNTHTHLRASAARTLYHSAAVCSRHSMVGVSAVAQQHSYHIRAVGNSHKVSLIILSLAHLHEGSLLRILRIEEFEH